MAIWSLLVFILNCVLFIVIGLQLPEVVREQIDYSLWRLIVYGAIASGVVILIRPLWVFAGAWLPRKLSKRLRERDPMLRHGVISLSFPGAECGGVVSLAAALGIAE